MLCKNVDDSIPHRTRADHRYIPNL